MKPIFVLMFAALLGASCSRHNSSGPPQPATQTIAPAAAQPAPNGTDQMTQTVEVDDSRSESDGMTATTPTRPPAKTKAPAKKKRK